MNFLKRLILGHVEHNWSRWELKEVKTTGLAAAFSGETTFLQTRHCVNCGLTQQTGTSVEWTPKECNLKYEDALTIAEASTPISEDDERPVH